MSTLQKWLAVLGLLVIMSVGAALGWWLRGMLQPAEQVPEVATAAPAVRQQDASLIAPRVQDPDPPAPPHQIPKGWKEERRVSATVEPERPGPVQLDLSIVRDDTGGRRAIVSSPDGPVIAATDVPIERGMVPAPARLWAAGIAASPFDPEGLSGAWVTRDYGRLRVGAVAFQWHGQAGGLALIGVTF